MMTKNELKRWGCLLAFGAAVMVAGSACSKQRAEDKKTKEKAAPESGAAEKGSSSKPRSASAADLKSAAELEKMAAAVEFPPLPDAKVISFVYGSGMHGGIEPSG
jgi:hypothetical protein